MPETMFTVRWPDGARSRCYSPSLVVREHLQEGGTYAVQEFVARSRTALLLASERVRAAYGFPCSRAAGTLADLERVAATHPPTATVVVEALS